MRRKSLSILTIMFMLFACVFASACGDKYGKLKFSISYAFTPDAVEWTEVDLQEGIKLNYGNTDGSLKLENGEANLFIKVKIKNVESKHVGKITITKDSDMTSGLNFTSKTVKQNEIFSVGLNGIVDSSLVFYENNSGKKCSVKLEISNDLDRIEVKTDELPALSLYGNDISLDLNSLNNLLYYPLNETNQLGVKYELISLGSYSNGTYLKTKEGEELADFVTLEENTVKVIDKTFFNDVTYVLRVKATSLYNEEKSVEFDIYLVEGNEPAPRLRFDSNDGVELVDHKIHLYENSTKYSSSVIYVDVDGENGEGALGSVYTEGVEIYDGTKVKYEPVIYVDGIKYNFEESTGINGLVIADLGGFGYRLSVDSRLIPTNKLSFAYEIVGLDINRSDSVNTTEVDVVKSVLPSIIMVNDLPYADGEGLDNIEVYDYEGANGYKMTLNVVPTAYDATNVASEREDILISKNSNFKIFDKFSELTAKDGYYTVKSGSTIYVKCVGSTDEGNKIEIKTKTVPSVYNEMSLSPSTDEDYVSTTFGFTRMATADLVEFYEDEALTDILDENEPFLFARDEHEYTNLFVKAYAKGNINPQTLTLTSNDDRIKFSNGTNSIRFDSGEVSKYYNVGTGIAGVSGYTLYGVKVKGAEEDINATFTLTVGDRIVGPISVRSVDTFDISSMKIELEGSANARKYNVDNGHFNFAIEAHKNISLSIQDNGGNTDGIYQLSLVRDNSGFDPQYFGENVNFTNGQLINNANVFTVSSDVAGLTHIVKLTIKYYYLIDGEIKEGNNTDNPIILEFAVYDPIADVVLTPSTNEVAYVNELYKTSMTMLFEVTGNPTKEIRFYQPNGDYIESNIAQLKFKINKTILQYFDIEFELGNDSIKPIIESGEYVLDALTGKLILGINSNPMVHDFDIEFAGMSFGRESGVGSAKTIIVKDVDRSEKITFVGKDVKEPTANLGYDYEVRLSYMGKATKADQKEFDVNIIYQNNGGDIRYKDLVFKLFEYDVDDEGNAIGDPIEISVSEALNIVETDGHVIVSAKTYGGKYRLDVYTKDSWNSVDGYSVGRSLGIRVDDGSEKFKYLLTNATEFDYIYSNDGLASHYELANNIDLGEIDRVVGMVDQDNFTAFTGGFDGKGYTLNYVINNAMATSGNNGNIVSLFGVIGTTEDAVTIKDLNLNVTFKSDIKGTDTNGLIVSGFVGELASKSKIDNVNLFVQSGNIVATSPNDIRYGGLVGVNNGSITDSSVKYSSELKIRSNAGQNSYIGAMIGKNVGSLEGDYAGRESLDSIKFDVFVNISLTAQTNVYYIGGIAGENIGTIDKMLVSGMITANDDKTESGVGTGYLAGIAGKSTNSIKTVALLALDLTSDITHIAGAVGDADDLNLDDVRYVSVKLEYEDNKYTFGKISGQNIVAGLITDAVDVDVDYCAVENFVQDEKFYTLSGAYVYGLINGQGNVDNTFCKADIYATNSAYVTTSAVQNNTYFIGIVNGTTNSGTGFTYSVINNVLYYGADTVALRENDKFEILDSGKTIANIMTKIENAESTYNYIYKLDNGEYVRYIPNENDGVDILDGNYYSLAYLPSMYVEISGENTSYLPILELDRLTAESIVYQLTYDNKEWSTFIAENIVNDTDNWSSTYDKNFIVLDTEDNVHIYLPFIIRDNKPIMIVAPTDIDAEISKEFVEDIHSVYVGDGKYDEDYMGENATHEISEMAIINYYSALGYEANTYNLRELIDLSIFPEDAQGGIRFEIVGSGYKYAHIIDEDITFTDVSGKTAIMVRCYSIFSPELEQYVAFYTQYGLSELTLSSHRISESSAESIDYEINLYSGDNAQLISVGAINNGDDNKTIFDSLEMTTNGVMEIDYIEIDQNGNNSNKVSVLVNGYNVKITVTNPDDIVAGDYVDITFSLLLKNGYFDHQVGDILLKTTTLRVYLHNSATDININADHHDIYTDSNLNISVGLTTGFVEEVDDNYEKYEIDDNGELYFVNAIDRDGIRIALECMDTDTEAFDKLLENAGLTRSEAMKLFEFEIYRTANKIGEGEDEKITGYTYDIQLQLVDDFDYRYIIRDIDLKFVVTANTNPNMVDEISVTLKPAVLTTTRVETYSVTEINPYSQYQNLVTNKNIENSIIAPGGIGSVMMIYLEPAYANVDKIVLSSDKIDVPTLSAGEGPVFLRYTQYIYDAGLSNPNAGKGGYVSYYGSDKPYQDIDTTEIELAKVSERIYQDGQYKEIYTGVIYVHVQLVRFDGYETDIRAHLDLTLTDGTVVPTIYKTLTTEYLPGASLSFNGEYAVSNGYMIQEDSYNNRAEIKIFGYQFNENPSMNIDWYLPDGSDLRYSSYIDANVDSKETFDALRADNKELWYEIDGKYYRAIEYKEKTIYYLVDNYDIITDGTTDYYYYVSEWVATYLITDFDDLKFNDSDDSYTIPVGFNVRGGIPASFSMSAGMSLITKDGQLESQNSEALIFYPVDYVMIEAGVKNLNNNDDFIISVGGTKYLEMSFTASGDVDASKNIFKTLHTDLGNDTANLLSIFRYAHEGIAYDFTNNDHIRAVYNNGKFIITGLAPANVEVLVSLDLYYVVDANGRVSLRFVGDPNTTLLEVSKEFNFTLDVYSATTEDEASPIYQASDMFNSDGTSALAENGHYILMNDIDLSSIEGGILPIDTKIASLDGNNKIIKVKSFKVDSAKKTDANYGLFASIGTYSINDDPNVYQTTLKNVIVDYSKFDGILSLTGNEITDISFGGIVGVNNGGLIYNCDVVNTNVVNTANIKLIVDNNNQETNSVVNVTFGGLVGCNNGIITNSRVGRESYEKITPTETGLSTTVTFGKLRFEIGSSTSRVFNVTAGGFVGENSGTISSSYVMRTDLINYSTMENDSSLENATAVANNNNKTAGFVGRNANEGDIQFSYVRGLNDTGTYYTGSLIENKGNGIVAGFVCLNQGFISNAYANITLKSESSYLSGFVFNNKGAISQAYSACELNTEASSDPSYAEQPFIGINNENECLSFGGLTNTYFYIPDTNKKYVFKENVPQARGLNKSNFEDSETMAGFAFVLSATSTERNQGIWSYYTIDSVKHSFPQLITADMIAHSCKYLDKISEGDDGRDIYEYLEVAEFSSGSENNPYIIRNVREYNSVFNPTLSDGSNAGSFTGFARFINNIEFSEIDEIRTLTKYTLGSDKNITSIEGNGMTISGIVLQSDSNVGESTDEENSSVDPTVIGLFANIENSYVKNLNLEFAKADNTGSEVDQGNQTNTTNVNIVGGLAGRINDSVIINMSLSAKNLVFGGENIVGGLAGIISGESLIYDIDSNIGVYVSNEDSTSIGVYSEKNDIAKSSFGGGLAGVIDLTTRSGLIKEGHNIAYIDIYGRDMTAEYGYTISAEYAGGLTGYAGVGVNVLKARYFTGKNDAIYGRSAVGGLVGVLAGSMQASQVTMLEGEGKQGDSMYDANNQYEIDSSFGEYVIDLAENVETAKFATDGRYGNVSLLRSDVYVGGLVGVGIRSKITESYAKASMASGKVIGGMIGGDIGSTITYSYAVPYINNKVTTNNNITTKNIGASYIGGLVGFSYGDTGVGEDINTYRGNSNNNVTDIQFTFSTILMDKDAKLTNNFGIDYLVNRPTHEEEDGSNGTKVVVENSARTNKYVFIGYINYPKLIEKDGEGNDIQKDLITNSLNVAKINLDILYDLEISEHETTFQDVFSSWSVSRYWSLNSNRYFPLLLNDEADNYTELKNDRRFYDMIKADPDGNFKIVEDIDISNCGSPLKNWVIDFEFTGTIVGEKKNSNDIPKLYNIHLTPDTDDSTGFFKMTKGASINNLKFVWGTGEDLAIKNENDKNITYMSGVSCEDENSLFSNLTVTTKSKRFTNSEAQAFGGIVGRAQSSNLVNCVFAGQVDITLTGDSSYFGGLVANASGSEGDASAMAISGSTVGADYDGNTNPYPTVFNIIIANGVGAHIGGAVGQSKNASLNNVNVGNQQFSDDNFKDVYINITDKNASVSETQFIGGLIANADNTPIVSAKANVELGLLEANSNYTIGGIAGRATFNAETRTSGIRDCTAFFRMSRISPETSTTTDNVTMIIGGIVGRVDTYASIQQSLSTGQINMTGMNVDTLYAGGIAGLISGKMSAREVMNNLNMIALIANESIYVGGLAGEIKGSLEIMHSLSAGRIVPITGNNCSDMAIGGLVGNIKTNENIKISNTYTTTSILTDSLSSKSVANMYNGALSRINALVGVDTDITKTSMTNVYYSSDYALASDSYEYSGAKNYNASTLVRNTQGWRTNLNKENGFNVEVWNYDDIKSKAPYIVSLVSDMEEYDIIDKGLYTSGSSLNPKEIGTEGFDANYTYYLLSAEQKSFENAHEEDNNKTLNGVLIISDSDRGIEIAGETNALVAEVGKNSAISNAHVYLTGDINTTADIGMIANINNGIIYNSSVQGTGIEVNASGRQLGLIAQQNAGIIMNSYSTAEIISTNARIGGIVDTISGSGKIVSSYFTGYIGNTSTVASGLFNSLTDSADYYIHNCYMAGVIEKIANNSMWGNANINEAHVSNNFIDGYANSERKVDNITIISATELMMNITTDATGNNRPVLFGQWHTMNVAGKMNIESKLFGYNYGYPVSKMNRNVQDLTYQLYTGDGSTTGDGKFDSRSDMLFAVDNKVNYNDAIKIPHLGVLSAIDKLISDNSIDNDNDGNIDWIDKNYVLIYDIDGKYLDSDSEFIEWTSVGSSGRFNGVFVSNKYYDQSTRADICTISNIAKAGLFTNIQNSYIGDLKIGGTFTNLQDSGVLGGTVLGSAGKVDGNIRSNVIINNISKGESVSIVGKSDSVGGLFGIIKGNVNIGTNVQLEMSIFGNREANYLGLIAGQVDKKTTEEDIESNNSYPVINFANDTGSVTRAGASRTLTVSLTGANVSAGGLVGNMIGGTILSGGDTINIKGRTADEGEDPNSIINTVYGGLVGITGDDENVKTSGIVSIKDFTVNFDDTPISTKTFGGFVGGVHAETQLVGATVLTIESASSGILNIDAGSLELGNEYYYGLITATNTKLLYIEDFTITSMKEVHFIGNGNDAIIDDDKNNNSVAAGLFIGYQAGNLAVGKMDSSELKLVADGLANLGGVSGIYTSGQMAINVDSTEITLDGMKNVGGVFGKVSGTISNATFNAEVKPEGIDAITGQDIMNKKWVDIEVSGGEENVGGLFGYVMSDIGQEEGSKAFAGMANIQNNNPITLVTLANENKKTATNIGGVAGYFGGKISNLPVSNNAEIKYANGATDDKKVSINSDGASSNTGSSEKSKSTRFVHAINVGGVYGYVNGGAISKISNTATVQGYQNVGGLIGYLAGATLTGDIENTLSVGADGKLKLGDSQESVNITSISTGEVTGVINVGGAVGYADKLQKNGDDYKKGTQNSISGVATSAKVYGNANVGALVGLALDAEIKNNFVGAPSLTDSLIVKGIYYNVCEEDDSTKYTASYIPTNVGGLMGMSFNSTAQNNVLYNVNITSARESDGKVISTISNHMMKGNIPTADSQNFIAYIEHMDFNDQDDHKVVFNDVKTGFGGFAGYTDAMHGYNNYIYGLDINAGLGINVGTYYGYTSTATIVATSFPTLYGNGKDPENKLEGNDFVLVDGAYNVGGYIGATDVVGKDYHLSNLDVNTKSKIVLQNRLTGFYVGGLIGRLTSQSATLHLEDIEDGTNKSFVRIDTRDMFKSYYVGGLVGKYITTNSSGSAFRGTIENSTTYASTLQLSDEEKDVIGHEIATNFGAYIGMLKVTGSQTNTIGVGGTSHNYPFTINTIENENYADGESGYNVEDSGTGTVQLYARAHYINLDNFSITGSDKWTNKNPLNLHAKGWSSEYAGFKVMQRCIPNNNSKTKDLSGDSIAIVYDASKITHVGTAKDLGLDSVTRQKNDKGEYYYDLGDEIKVEPKNENIIASNETLYKYLISTKGDPDRRREDYDWYAYKHDSEGNWTGNVWALVPADFIVFTVYEDEVGSPKLYSRIGIAQALKYEDREDWNGEYQFWSWKDGWIWDNYNNEWFDYNEENEDLTGLNNLIDKINKEYKDDKTDSIIVRKIEKIIDLKGEEENVTNYYEIVRYWDGKEEEFKKPMYLTSTMEEEEEEGVTFSRDRFANKELSYYTKTHQNLCIYDYFLTEYMVGSDYEGDAIKEISKTGNPDNKTKGVAFDFVTIYDNRSVGCDDTLLPSSGSIFEVTGSRGWEYQDAASAWTKFWRGFVDFLTSLVTWLGVALAIIGIIASLGLKIVTFGAAPTELIIGGILLALSGFVIGSLSDAAFEEYIYDCLNKVEYVNASSEHYLGQTNHNFGVLGDIAYMNVEYNDGKLEATVNDIYNSSDGFFYYAYSSQRPEGFDTTKVAKDVELKNGEYKYKKDSKQFIIDIRDYDIIRDAEYGVCLAQHKKTGAVVAITDAYIYYEGQYWINGEAGERSSRPVNLSDKTNNVIAPYAIIRNGYAYVYSLYNGTDYSLSKNAYTIMGDNFNFSDNYVTYDATSKTYSLFGATLKDATATQSYDFVRSNGSPRGVHGYHYLQTAYYKLRGTKLFASAEFNYVGESYDTTNKTAGVDYIKVVYEYLEENAEGNLETKTKDRYYEFNDIVKSNPDNMIYQESMKINTELDKIYISLYDASFTQPVDGLYITDNKTYTIDDGNQEGIKISHECVYFRYEGGYSYFMNDEGEYYYAIKITNLSEGINVLATETSTTSEVVKYKDLKDKYYTEYRDKYVDINGETVAIKDVFGIDANGDLVMRSTQYSISNSTTEDRIGLVDYYINLDNYTEYDKLIANKYLSNPEYMMYTKYKYKHDSRDFDLYIDGNLSDSERKGYPWIGQHDYYVIPTNKDSNQPNKGITIFVERVQCTIGGGRVLTKAGTQNATRSGKITVT